MGELRKIDVRQAQALPVEEIGARLKRMVSIMTAIDAGDLLSGLPECPAARANHAVALDLMAILQAELSSLNDEFDAGWGSV
jgi:hypothetical protein